MRRGGRARHLLRIVALDTQVVLLQLESACKAGPVESVRVSVGVGVALQHTDTRTRVVDGVDEAHEQRARVQREALREFAREQLEVDAGAGRHDSSHAGSALGACRAQQPPGALDTTSDTANATEADPRRTLARNSEWRFASINKAARRARREEERK